MPTIFIDNREYPLSENRNCLEAALEHDLDLPYFCYHPALGAVGACRLCAVKLYKDASDQTGRLVMSCMTPAPAGTRFAINDAEATAFRKTVIELLMTNHPHDCPICDEGGECHLQDMTVMTGHRVRRYRGTKRTHRNQYLGPLIHHEMNRCIQCYRCTRYYQEYAGGHDLVVLAQRNRVYFGRHQDGVLENPFAGNVIDICPTGVFTDKTFKRHFTRKWDLETAPSICIHCSFGCNTLPAARYGELRRVTPRYNEAVNGYFICDRGRFGYEYANAESRLREPSVKNALARQAIDRDRAWRELQAVVASGYPIAGIGSPRASIESNYALQRLVGRENFSHGLSERDHQMVQVALASYRAGEGKPPTLRDLETADVIWVLGCDVTHELPRVDLAIRQAVKQGGRLGIAATRATPLDEIAHHRHSFAPDELVTWVATHRTAGHPLETALAQAKRPLLIVGGLTGVALWNEVRRLAAQLRDRGSTPSLLFGVNDANSMGVGLLGGLAIETLLERIERGEIERAVVVENDLFSQGVEPARIKKALQRLKTLIVFDHSESETVFHADLAIPVAAPPEAGGLWVSALGRAGRAFQVYRPEPWVPASWMVLRALPAADGSYPGAGWASPDELMASLAAENPLFQPALTITSIAPQRRGGQQIPRQGHRASGRMALPVWKDIREHPAPPFDRESPFNFSMEGYTGDIPPDWIPRFWAPNWNSQEAINKYQIELGKGLHGGASGVGLFNASLPLDGGGSGRGWSQGHPPLNPLPSREGRKNELLLVPVAEIFGSERLSRLSPAIAELTPTPYLELHPQTAKQLKLGTGTLQQLAWDGHRTALQVRFNETLPLGVGVVPAGFHETDYLRQPIVAELKGVS